LAVVAGVLVGVEGIEMANVNSRSSSAWVCRLRYLVFAVTVPLFTMGCEDKPSAGPGRVILGGRSATVGLPDGRAATVRTWVFRPSDHLGGLAKKLGDRNRREIEMCKRILARDMPDNMRRSFEEDLKNAEGGERGYAEFDEHSRVKLVSIPTLYTEPSRRVWLIVVRSARSDIVVAIESRSNWKTREAFGLAREYAEWVAEHSGSRSVRDKVIKNDYLDGDFKLTYDEILRHMRIDDEDFEFPEQS